MYPSVLPRYPLTVRNGQPQYDRPAFASDVLMRHVPQVERLLNEMMDMDPTRRPTAREAWQAFKAARDAVPDYIRFSPPEGYAAEYGPNVTNSKKE
jgi:phospholipase C